MASTHTFKIGDRVILDHDHNWDGMPMESQGAFLYARYHYCPISGFTDEGLAILDLQSGDAELGGKFNDIRIEPEHLRMVVRVPQTPEGAGAADESQFPVVEGFTLAFVKSGSGMNVEMRDAADKGLASFLYDDVEKKVPTYGAPHFPLGTAARPYFDCDQGWNLLIWEAKGFVWVGEGRGEDQCDTYDVHFRVPLDAYLSEWKRLGDEAAGSKEIFDNLDDALARPEAVKELALGQQHLTKLPDVFSRFINLERLNLTFNRLTSLPDSVGDLKNLRYLNLMENELSSLPSSLAKLDKLDTALLARNKLTAIPGFVAGMTSLKEFMVNYNPIPAEQVKALKAARPDMRVDPGMDDKHFPWLGY